jgi:hypothetical protein
MKKLLTIGIILATLIMFLNSCQNKFIIEPVPEPTDTISFSQQITPIWVEQGCTGCHTTTGQQPDLSVDNAYLSITGMGLVNINDPIQSKVYYYPKPDGNHYAKYTSAQASMVLQWIEDGALND